MSRVPPPPGARGGRTGRLEGSDPSPPRSAGGDGGEGTASGSPTGKASLWACTESCPLLALPGGRMQAPPLKRSPPGLLGEGSSPSGSSGRWIQPLSGWFGFRGEIGGLLACPAQRPGWFRDRDLRFCGFAQSSPVAQRSRSLRGPEPDLTRTASHDRCVSRRRVRLTEPAFQDRQRPLLPVGLSLTWTGWSCEHTRRGLCGHSPLRSSVHEAARRKPTPDRSEAELSRVLMGKMD